MSVIWSTPRVITTTDSLSSGIENRRESSFRRNTLVTDPLWSSAATITRSSGFDWISKLDEPGLHATKSTTGSQRRTCQTYQGAASVRRGC